MSLLVLLTALAQPAEADLTGAQTTLAQVLLDDRAPTDERAEAARELGRSGTADVLWLLRAAAYDHRFPDVQHAALQAVSPSPDPEATAILALVAGDTLTDREVRRFAVEALAAHGSEPAGRALLVLAQSRHVPSALRTLARDALLDHHPDLVAREGLKPVSDVIGGGSFALAWGVAGGTALNAVGTWGQFDAGEVIGALGGTAIGVGGAAWAVSRTPVTTGQGLAQASGTGWGLAAGVWTTNAIYGRPRFLYYDRSNEALLDRRRNVGAAARLVGVTAGSTLGVVWLRQQPDAWDVLEVDLATYLGSAIALSGTGLTLWRPGQWEREHGADTPAHWEARWRASRALDGSNLVGAALGMGAGFALKNRWELDADDAAFAMVLGAEGAWVGSFLPDAVGIEDRDLKGTVRLPWNASIALGLAVSELHPMSLQTTGVTAVTMASGNAIGAGIPLALRADDDRTVAQVMLPLGLAGTVGGVFAAPWFDPGPGEWSMVALSSGLSAYNVGAIAAATDLDGAQITGLTLIGTGLGSTGALTAGHFVHPRADHMLTLGSAAAWGSFYGLLGPIAVGDQLADDYRPLVAVIGADLFVGGTAVALSDGVGLRPRSTLIPQLAGLTGATLGALGVGLVSTENEAVARGALIGATLGLGGGAFAVASSRPANNPPRTARLAPLPGVWMPTVHPGVIDDEPALFVGVQGRGW